MENMEAMFMTKPEHHDLEAEQKQQIFDAQSPMMDAIRTQGFNAYAKTLENLGKAFDPEEHELSPESGPCACCMDGRTKYGFRAAGSGMLLPEDELLAFLKAHNIKTVTAHEGCGAAKLYCERQGLPTENSDQIAQEWGQSVATRYGLEYAYLPLERMGPSLEFHPERVCYCDATGNFSNLDDDRLPEGFGIDCSAKKEERWLEEIRIALDIAFGHHGLGERFTAETPFVLTAIAEDERQLSELKEKLRALKHDYGDRVSIDGFVKPE
jgi:hypothetical protein